jgi:GT2 family glycosyltransferase
MRKKGDKAIALLPQYGIQILHGRTVAESIPAWLQLELAKTSRGAGWVRIRYRTSLFDDNVRPLIRFSDGENDGIAQPMNGSLFGVGEWIGYIPEKTSKILISPVARPGPFDFEIERIDRISPLHLLWRGALTNPRWIAWMVQTQMIGAREEAQRALKLASTSTAFADYHEWHRRLSRPLDLNGIDRPRANWRRTAKFRLFMSVDETASDVQKTFRSLLAQVYARWSLHILIDPAAQAEIRSRILSDKRISEITEATELAAIAADFSDNDFCARISAGNILPDYALATIAEAIALRPKVTAVYGDEDAMTLSGELHSPRLRPDWSPYFQTGGRYVDELFCLRAADLLQGGCTKAAHFFSENRKIAVPLGGDGAVHHIRRVLYRRSMDKAEAKAAVDAIAHARATSRASYPEAAVIVLSRDNAECLACCIEGLTTKTDYPNLRIVLVDNGSTEAKAVALLRDLRRDPRIDVLERPGPFNFSALCNDAVRATQPPLLVFINDDVEMRDSNWLKPLARWAHRPDVGIVGAKLLFPTGRIQHAGVVVGLGGIAAHEYHNADMREAGYLQRLQVAHEVGAVTAACIAIERKKFESVGGFDAANLPVDLNDIDLCLRLAERGFITMWTPESVLIHHESQTRGRLRWSPDLYRAERAYFIARWQAVIRDDRFFHPDLSLFSYRPALA